MDLIKLKLAFKKMRNARHRLEKISARHITKENFIKILKRAVQVNNNKRNNPIKWWAKKF